MPCNDFVFYSVGSGDSCRGVNVSTNWGANNRNAISNQKEFITLPPVCCIFKICEHSKRLRLDGSTKKLLNEFFPLLSLNLTVVEFGCDKTTRPNALSFPCKKNCNSAAIFYYL
jgi:hypothetical protein